MKWHNTEVSKHYSEASAQEMQRRLAEHLQATVNDAVDAAENLKTALHELGKVIGDNPLDWRYGFHGYPKKEMRTILDELIKDLEGVRDE